jgi:hypothetical protein
MCPRNTFKSLTVCLEKCDGISTCEAGQRALALQSKKMKETEEPSMKPETVEVMSEKAYDTALKEKDPVMYIMNIYKATLDHAFKILTENQKRYSQTVWENAKTHNDPVDWYANVFKVTRHVAQNRIYSYRKKYKHAPARELKEEDPVASNDADEDEVSILDFLKEQETGGEQKEKEVPKKESSLPVEKKTSLPAGKTVQKISMLPQVAPEKKESRSASSLDEKQAEIVQKKEMLKQQIEEIQAKIRELEEKEHAIEVVKKMFE